MARRYPKLPKWFDISRGCARKVAYRTLGQAWAEANVLGHRVYECPMCKWWHRTSSR